MTINLQPHYSSGLRQAVNGQLSDTTEYEIGSFQCGEANGIGYGVVVSESTTDAKTALLGGGKFLGVTVRDITVDNLSIGSGAQTRGDADKYVYLGNMAVMSRGRCWIEAQNIVAPGDAVYFDYVTGQIGNSASGMAARGSIAFTQNPAADDTITLGETTITFKAESPSTNEVLLGASLGETLTNLETALNASDDSEVTKAKYRAYPAGESADTMLIAYETAGAGNDFALATDVEGATVSDDALSGAYAGTAPSGYIDFTEQPTADQTITLNGTAIAFKDSGATGDNVDIGLDLDATLAALKTKLNASVNAQVAKCTYDVVDHRLTIVSDTVGTTNNAFTIATTVTGATRSAATLSGGIVASVAVGHGRWMSAARVGELALLSLGYQV